MPHIIVKLFAGRSDEQKLHVAEKVTEAVVEALNCGPESVSVGIEDVESQDWAEKVYTPDILDKAGTIYRKPGYNPL